MAWRTEPTNSGAVLWQNDTVIAVFPHDAAACARAAELLNRDDVAQERGKCQPRPLTWPLRVANQGGSNG